MVSKRTNDDIAKSVLREVGYGLHGTKGAVPLILESIAYSLVGLNEKIDTAMKQEGLGTPGPSKVVGFKAENGTVKQVLIECTDTSLEWVPVSPEPQYKRVIMVDCEGAITCDCGLNDCGHCMPTATDEQDT